MKQIRVNISSLAQYLQEKYKNCWREFFL
jgi:hypothetical protein